MKLHATERMRIAIDDAMDIQRRQGRDRRPAELHGQSLSFGAGRHHRRGRQLLTRNLIVFGQGAIRAHPYLLEEMNALGEQDHARDSMPSTRRSGATSATVL